MGLPLVQLQKLTAACVADMARGKDGALSVRCQQEADLNPERKIQKQLLVTWKLQMRQLNWQAEWTPVGVFCFTPAFSYVSRDINLAIALTGTVCRPLVKVCCYRVLPVDGCYL